MLSTLSNFFLGQLLKQSFTWEFAINKNKNISLNCVHNSLEILSFLYSFFHNFSFHWFHNYTES